MRFAKHLFLPLAMVHAFLFPVLLYGQERSPQITPLHRWQRLQVENNLQHLRLPLYERIKPIPDYRIRQLWGKTKKIRPYELSPEDIGIFTKAVSYLPDVYIDHLRNHLLNIYFVDGFKRSGWLQKIGANTYEIILSSKLLKQSVYDFLNTKEATVFAYQDSVYTVEIQATNDRSGIWFVLLHETAHLVDGNRSISAFTYDIWDQKSIPKANFEFDFRDRIHFYRGEKIPESKILQIYRDLSKTPFPSLYASLNWAEDFAEFAALYYMTQIEGLPYRIVVREGKNEVFSYAPMDDPKILSRYTEVKKLLKFER